MKFGTLLELNSNVEWWSYYVDYGALKKLFPSTPLDPSYHSTNQESTSLLPTHQDRSKKFASPEEFREALDREKQKVEEFYRHKEDELHHALDLLEDEVAAIEERDLGTDDVIKEEDEDDDDEDEDDEGVRHSRSGNERSPLINSTTSNAPRAPSRPRRSKSSILRRFGNFAGRRRSAINTTHEADILEASFAPSIDRARSSSTSQGMGASVSTLDTPSLEEPGPISPNVFSPIHRANSSKRPNGPRTTSDFDLEDSAVVGHGRDRRTSGSSISSHEQDVWQARRKHLSLGLVQMDPTSIPPIIAMSRYHQNQNENAEDESGEMEQRPVYVWTANNDYGTVLRIGFKKRISAVWLEAYALKQYVDLNLTAFEKILKKYDKNTGNKLKKDYVTNSVLTSYPWSSATTSDLDNFLSRILFLYRRVATSGDEELAKEQLRSQLREKVVVDRETVWSQMVSGRREQGIFRSVNQEIDVPSFEAKSAFGRRWPAWLTAKTCILLLALGVLVAIVQIQPFERVEESNCLAMLIFCTILWATEAIPLFVTSLAVPLLVVFLRVLRSQDADDIRLSASDATKYIFSQMFSPTIMLLIGGFTIAAVLSKTRLDVMTATRVLNAAGTRPSVVLLVLMCVATFASMWISNVAAPTLCYALIKPITDELHPKSVFSKCLIIAIALASNIGGQASPISSPQNLIALGSMNPPLSWLEWFAISIPVSACSVLAIWAFLHVNYKWESDLTIPKMRPNTDSLSKTHYFVLVVSALTIALWCAEKSIEGSVGDMGIIAIIPLLAFFGTGILSKEDFHSFHWSIVFLAMGGIALGKATLSSGLLDDLDKVLENLVDGMGLYSILVVFSGLSLVIATFISHTIAAVLLVPIAERIGESLDEPHPRLLIMVTALICSAGMGLPVSGFPNMTAITQENKLGQRFIGASDFLKNGIPASILATFIIGTIGYAIMRAIGLPLLHRSSIYGANPIGGRRKDSSDAIAGEEDVPLLNLAMAESSKPSSGKKVEADVIDPFSDEGDIYDESNGRISRNAEYRIKAEGLASLVEDSELPGGRTFAELSLYEKKSALINRELDLMGMGRYQWCIFFLCGFGYFLDLCWAQAGGLVAPAIHQEFGVGDDSVGDLAVAFNVGLTVGAFTWGILVDVVGRRWCFNLTCLIASVFGFLFALPSSYGAVCFMYCMIGFGVGGNIPIDATITIEFLPKNRRFLLATLSTFQPIGVVVASLIAFGLIPSNSCGDELPACRSGETPCCTKASNMGWRYTMITLGAITLFIFLLRFIVFTFRESPKFLLVKGHDAHALDVLYSVAAFNGKPAPSLTMDDFRALELEEASKDSKSIVSATTISTLKRSSRPSGFLDAFKATFVGGLESLFGHLRGLFAERLYQYLFAVMAVAYMSDFWSFNIAGYFLPLILRARGIDTAGQSVADTYRSYVYIYLPGITATFAASAIMEVPRLGRKWAMVISALLMGASLIMYQLVDSIAANIGFNAMEYWFQSLYNALLYAFTPEIFPAPFRGSASGMLSTLGRIAGIVAPIATSKVYNGSDSPGVLWLGAGGAWVSALAIALLPYETRGKQAF